MIARRVASLCGLLALVTACTFEHYTLAGRRAVANALGHAQQRGAIAIGTEHLLLGVAQEDPDLVVRVGRRANFTLASLQEEVDRVSPVRARSGSAPVELPLEPDAAKVLEIRPPNHADVSPQDLLLGLFTAPGKAGTILRNVGVTEDILRAEIKTE